MIDGDERHGALLQYCLFSSASSSFVCSVTGIVCMRKSVYDNQMCFVNFRCWF